MATLAEIPAVIVVKYQCDSSSKSISNSIGVVKVPATAVAGIPARMVVAISEY